MKILTGSSAVVMLCVHFLALSHNPQELFTNIYLTGVWMDGESYSGPGSNLVQTEVIRKEIPRILHELRAESLLDAPCGDFYWMKEVALDINYIGFDIVAAMIEKNSKLYSNSHIQFLCGDLLNDPLPKVDVILCRDCLVHFSYQDIWKALKNFKKSQSKYLLTTTFPRHKNNDIKMGDWRPLNLQAAPFNLPNPLIILNERCTQNAGNTDSYSDKSLALWNLDEISVE